MVIHFHCSFKILTIYLLQLLRTYKVFVLSYLFLFQTDLELLWRIVSIVFCNNLFLFGCSFGSSYPAKLVLLDDCKFLRFQIVL